MSYTLMSREGWPTPSQRLLLKVALCRDAEALHAWEAWRADNTLDAADHASFFVWPQLFVNLRRLGVTAPEMETLRGIYRYTWCKNQTATRSIMEVFGLLAAEAIPSILLKGAPLMLFHYGDPGARLMNDIDVLVPERDLPAAAAVLSAREWCLTKPLPPTDFLPYVHAASLTHPRWIELDLHWRALTVDCPREEEAKLWDRAVTRAVHGAAVRVPDPTDLLLLTCYHGRKRDEHGTCRWVIDAMMLVEDASAPVAWETLLERAEATGLLAPVRDALTYLRQEFAANVPDEVLQRAWAIPSTARDRTRYEKHLAGFSLRGLSLWGLLVFHWTRFASVQRGQGRRPGLLGFARYLLAYHQWVFDVERRWQVPFVMVGRVLGRLTRRLTARSQVEQPSPNAPVA